MTTMDIDRIFPTSTTSLQQFFNGRVGVTYYIPLYQREYSWGTEEAGQLLEDIVRGVSSFAEDGSDDSTKNRIKFLGTIILVREQEPYESINPKNRQALPQVIDKVIDGQQRLSTLALLATQLYARLDKYENLPWVEEDGLKSAVTDNLDFLKAMFSFRLGRGKPKFKPLIIRGSEDEWVLEGNLDEHYPSPVTNFIAKAILATNKGADGLPAQPFPGRGDTNNQRIKAVLKQIKDALDTVENAHLKNEDEYIPSWKIVNHYSQIELWQYQRDDLANTILGFEGVALNTRQKGLSALVQLLAFTHFLLYRCCFTLIQPSNEEWGFDMFQSLNGTGTPLTAIETFKPLVVSAARHEQIKFEDTTYGQQFKEVDELFKDTNTAAEKTKLTNEFLIVFAITYNGFKLSSQFSEQRRKLIDWFPEDPDGRKVFVKHFSNLASYWQRYKKLKSSNPDMDTFQDKLPSDERDVATLCQLYLINAAHTMSNSVLSRYFGDPGDKSDADKKSFARAVKAVAAYYTLWRSAQPNTNLDSSYRAMFSTSLSLEKSTDKPSVEELKKQMRQRLILEGLDTFDNWFAKTKDHLSYRPGLQAICRFALFIYAHDTGDQPGNAPLLEIGNSGLANYLVPSYWTSPNFSTIEHIAPQNPPETSNWPSDIYDQGKSHQIGNLTLLPMEINASVGNQDWKRKWYYYSFLGLDTVTARDNLRQKAIDEGVILNSSTLDALINSDHSKHVRPLQILDKDAVWNAALIDSRTKNICEILYQRMCKWLEEIPQPVTPATS